MARLGNTNGEGSRRGRGSGGEHQDGRMHARYTKEQIEVLEQVYAQYPNPDNLQREQIVQDHPILSGVDIKQLKVWFQNRRCREKQKKENVDLVTENKRLASANKALQEDNDVLRKKISQVLSENERLCNQIRGLTSSISTCDVGRQPEANNPQMPIRIGDNNRSLLLIAEKTREEFLTKAIGTSLNWIPASGLKFLHNTGSVGNIFISSTHDGMAARACVTIPLDPVKTIEILKDRISWSRNCRSMDVIANYPANNGGIVEIVYSQYFAPTTLGCARDFWALRYSSTLKDGSYLVCEKSISDSDAALSSPAALEFVRGHMRASGYLVCPRDGESTIYIVGHMDLEESSIPEVIKPLYESPEIAAKQMVAAPIHYIEHTINETNGKGKPVKPGREDPVQLRYSSERLCRGFNEAVNCLSEDGWTLMNSDATSNIVMSVKRTQNSGSYVNYDSIICIRAYLLLQNVLPVSMTRVLKEKRSAWMNFDLPNTSSSPLQLPCFSYPILSINQLSEYPVFLGHTNHENESLDIIQFEASDRQHNVPSGLLYYLELINGMEDTGFGASSELIFAQIDRNLSKDSKLLSNGFRVILLGSNTEETNVNNTGATVQHPPSMLTMAFQFPFEAHLQDEIVVTAQKYVQHVMSRVTILSREAMPSETNPGMNITQANPSTEITPQYTFAMNLANLICQSYRFNLGVDLLGINSQTNDSKVELIHNHQYAILCFSFSSLPMCLYANRVALAILETTVDNLQTLTMDRVIGGPNNSSPLHSILPTLMQQGCAVLPAGTIVSLANHYVSYGQAVVWQVRGLDGSMHCFALAFIDSSYVSLI